MEILNFDVSRPDRLRDIADRFNVDHDAVLDNVLYARAYTSKTITATSMISMFFLQGSHLNSLQFINWDGPLYEDHKESFAANKRSCKLASVFCFWCCTLSRLAQCKYSSSAALHKVLQFATTLSELCHVYDEGQHSILVKRSTN